MMTIEDITDYLSGRQEQDDRRVSASAVHDPRSEVSRQLEAIREHSVAITGWSAAPTTLPLACHLIGVEVAGGEVRPISCRRVLGFALARSVFTAFFTWWATVTLAKAGVSWPWQLAAALFGGSVVVLLVARTLVEWRGHVGTVLEASSSGVYTYCITLMVVLPPVVVLAMVAEGPGLWMARHLDVFALPVALVGTMVGLERGFGFRTRLLLGQIQYSDVFRQWTCIVVSLGIYFWFVGRNSEFLFKGPWWQNVPPVTAGSAIMLFRQATTPSRVAASWRQVRFAVVSYALLICVPAAPWVLRTLITADDEMAVFDAVGIAVLAVSLAGDDLLCGVARVRRRIIGLVHFARTAIGGSAGYAFACLLTGAFPQGWPLSFGQLAVCLGVLGAVVGNTRVAVMLFPGRMRGWMSRHFESVFPASVEVTSRSWRSTFWEVPGLGAILVLAYQIVYGVEIVVETFRLIWGTLTRRPAFLTP